MLSIRHIIFFTLIILVAACSDKPQNTELNNPIGEVHFISSDDELNHAWDWAKATALSYVRQGDTVGPWYEAALPGRDAFCMRDLSHQTSGAAILGLNEHNKNMLFRFAENISESKDWCSYWEINKDNQPAPVDFKNDKDFWYNLPANFDVVDACLRMFEWTGDTTYIHHPVFLNFYEKTANEYVERWNLSAERILLRERIMNLPQGSTPENNHYYDKRGIPGYHEGAGGKMQLGIDQLAVQYIANQWFHFLFGDSIQSKYRDEANAIDSLISTVFWDEEEKNFRIIQYADGSFDYSVGTGMDFSHMLLHYKVLNEHIMINSILDHYSEQKDELIIEIASHMPDIFFRYGRPNDGIYMLKSLTDSTRHRRDYPENSFSVVGAFVNGLMGVTADAVFNYITTFSGLEDPDAWAMVSSLPVLNKKIDLLHQGRHTSVLRNHSTDTIFWSPYLEGIRNEWYIDGKKSGRFAKETVLFGTLVTSWLLKVYPHSTMSVSALPPR